MSRSTALAAILLVMPAAPALAQNASTPAQTVRTSPTGDWNATLVTPQRTMHLGFTIKEDASGKLSGTMGSHDNGVWDRPLSDIVVNGDTLSFSVADSSSNFTGKWDAGAWTGTYTNPAGTFPLKLAQGAVPPLPTLTGLDGRWEGTLDVQGMQLKIVIRTKTDAHGTTALMDSPTQGANGIPISGLKREANLVAFDVPSIRGKYEGNLSTDGAKLLGMWAQMGNSIPLALTRVSDSIELAKSGRPQTPKAPFPYKSEDVAYDNPKAPGVRLACTLTTPNASGKHPAAILITGSGGQDRNETLLDHQVFGVLADHLTRKGIAVLRCDDRGIAKSTGVFLNATPKDFATDVEAGLAFLRTRPDIDSKRIGLIGHSEGSVTGPQVVMDDPGVAFLVMLGGLGAKGVDVMTEQRTLITMALGIPPEQEPMVRAGSSAMFNVIVSAPDEKTAQQNIGAMLRLSSGGAMSEEDAMEMAKEFTTPYMRDLLAYDPAPVLSKITIPVLAITGAKDLQVPPKQNLPLIKSLMAQNPDVTTIELPDLNHLFQTAKTGAPSEYGEIEETFAPAALDEISNWILQRMKP